MKHEHHIYTYWLYLLGLYCLHDDMAKYIPLLRKVKEYERLH